MEILSSVIAQVGKSLWLPLSRHASYLFCYNMHVKDLENQVEKLEQMRADIRLDVEAATAKGDIVRDEVWRWLASADAVRSEASSIAGRSSSAQCSMLRCLSYTLGKEAAKNAAVADELWRNGKFDRVARPPPPPSTDSLYLSRGLTAFASTESSMKRVLQALQDDTIRIFGVYGMGGVGKTTLMKEVAKRAKSEGLVDEVVMVTVSQNLSLRRIQTEMGEKLGLRLEEESESVRAARLSSRLKRVRKSLVILDDLWEPLELSNVGIPCGEHRGCKVAITTRSSNVCSVMESQRKIEVQALSEEEGWTLFQSKAGDVVKSTSLGKLARDVAGECQGLPLAIVTLGAVLRDKTDVRMWHAVLQQLQKSLPMNIEGMRKQVFQSIKLSYDYLESDEAKLCFLLCCLFPEDHEIDVKSFTLYAVGEGFLKHIEALEDAHSQVHCMFDNLKASSLLFEGNRAGCVMMHDVVRDVAVWIASETAHGIYSRTGCGLKEWPESWKPEECQRISLMNNEITVLPEEPSCPKLKTLVLNGNRRLKRIPNRFFQKMEALAVLELSKTGILSLPASLTCLTNLTTLFLEECHRLSNAFLIGRLKNLQILSLQYSSIHMLPREIGELMNLRYLDLTCTRCIVPPGVISRLCSLEQLYMAGGFSEWQAEGGTDPNFAAFAELAHLPRLTTLFVNVQDKTCFAQDLGKDALGKLVRFWICPAIYRVREPETSLRLTVGTPVPDWAQRLLEKMQDLTLIGCLGMKCLVGAGGGDIPHTTFSDISILELFHLRDLSRLCDGPPPDGFLRKLSVMLVFGCNELIEILPTDLMLGVQLLEELRVSGCSRLPAVFNNNHASGGGQDAVLLPRLQTLELDHLQELTNIWNGAVPRGSLLRLSKIIITQCHSLTCALSPALAAALRNLEVLHIEYCREVTEIISNAMKGTLQAYQNLRTLVIDGCLRLTSLFSWRQVQSLWQLEEIKVFTCIRLETIITAEEETLGDKRKVLPRLRRLELDASDQLSSFHTQGALPLDLPSLEVIFVKSCPRLKMLPMGPLSAPNLEAIEGSEDWFQALEWEDETTKSRLQNLFHPF